ncbi:hypothetical protein SKAU_G00153770 [Synaphobranchus kaupii]|uniref:Uncharacterized protein n=1 Tax=Synaphobranchus kaupii TaxID=118154 RepID=A0A9Q1FH62_SYNKA|nr:hypothetical protein SKAU_G00153770 [Synaphobranchus kaupii]
MRHVLIRSICLRASNTDPFARQQHGESLQGLSLTGDGGLFENGGMLATAGSSVAAEAPNAGRNGALQAITCYFLWLCFTQRALRPVRLFSWSRGGSEEQVVVPATAHFLTDERRAPFSLSHAGPGLHVTPSDPPVITPIWAPGDPPLPGRDPTRSGGEPSQQPIAAGKQRREKRSKAGPHAAERPR